MSVPSPSKGSTLLEPNAAFERVKIARHSERPYTLDYVEQLFENFIELKGDRRFGDDAAIVCGFADFRGKPIAVIGQQKGRDIKQRRFRNFGMPKPEGYRKAIRVMKLAEKFGRPIISFIDTPGAYPGIDAEERGQAEAIACNLLIMSRLSVPIVVAVIGEGGSGGALAIGVGDRVLMLENAVYSVISPEGCAAILWKDASVAPTAAESLCLTADNLKRLGIVDVIVPEAKGGAHTSYHESAQILGAAIHESLEEIRTLSHRTRLERRYDKLRQIGL
ncbi:MAG: acetyl-CoA carboxylase carboxyltransferase subunit alpha [Acidobacteriota bacterium]|nr:acetyl-CoA carboxylase carboxyltransferase subunit alpha [Acidobacteriota bacterium]